MFQKTRLIMVTVLVTVSTLSYSFVNSSYFEVTKNLELFANIFKELDAMYVDQIEPNDLVRTGIDAMLGSLDPYTSFISEEDMAGYKLQTTGKYGGIGALIRKKDDYVLIAEPYEGFPAFKAGLMAGDKIIKVGDMDAKGKNTEDISKVLKGQPGTSVKIVVERLGEQNPLQKELTREEITIKSVPYYGMLDNKTGYIRLTNFTENCGEEVSDALKDLKDKHQMTSVVLDLRDNPGGLLNEAINVANVFVPRGVEVVSTKSKKRDWDKIYKTRREPVDTEIDLVVLINRGSASASEIVAGVVQDLDRGVIIGKRSFGKGLVQTTKNVGYNSKIKLTTAKYYLPTGRCIQAIDYSGGYNDNLEKVPDSLRTAYKTPNGRTILDAGGIDPDVNTERGKYANITGSLMGKQLIFDYATIYRSEHPTIPNPDQFDLKDADFDAFVAFLADKDYDYTTASEKLLTDLKENAEKEKYLAAIEADLVELDAKIKHDKNKDLQKFRSEIQQLLEYEIVSRYYYQKGRIQETLEDDEDILKALEILKQNIEYNKILTAKK